MSDFAYRFLYGFCLGIITGFLFDIIWTNFHALH